MKPTSRQTTTAKRHTPSMKAAVMMVTPRMSPAASGCRATDSTAEEAIREMPMPAAIAAMAAPMAAPNMPRATPHSTFNASRKSILVLPSE
jgi:hypothetical protein